MKKGLVMEGGGMRGMFTCGVTDVFLENGIEFDGAAGVSAGAAFGCNFKSKQPGRALRYNMLFSKDERYMGLSSLLKTGDLYNVDFCYREIPDKLDVFDRKAFRENPMKFYVVSTDADTGKPLYYNCKNCDDKDITAIRASASMPLASRPVSFGGRKLLDGGISDSIPIKFMEKKGYDKIVVILTQPKSYRKEKNKLLPLMRIFLKDYPNVIEAMKIRHIKYNKTTDYIRQKEEAGDVFVIAPPAPMNISRTEKSADKLERVYNLGRITAEKNLGKLKSFLKTG